MKALVWDGELRLDRFTQKAELPGGEALIRTLLAGICNTDLEIVKGYTGFTGVLGHEFVGIVEQADDRSLVGQRVVGSINVPCKACPICDIGLFQHCPKRSALGIRGRNGAFAEFFMLPIENLHIVPELIPDERAVFCEPLAAAFEILEQAQLRPTDRVIVLGDGKLGLFVAQVLALTGCDLTVVGRHPEKLRILERRGIDTHCGEMETGRLVDYVVECTGRSEGFDAARRLLRPQGTIVLKSTYHGISSVDLSALVVDEIQVLGSRCGPFSPALRLLESDWVDTTSMIDAVYSLDDAVQAVEHAARRGALKVLVRP